MRDCVAIFLPFPASFRSDHFTHTSLQKIYQYEDKAEYHLARRGNGVDIPSPVCFAGPGNRWKIEQYNKKQLIYS